MLIVVAALFLIMGWLLLPETGIWGMVNEAISSIFILSWGIYFLIGGIRKKKEDKGAFILGIAVFVCIFSFGGWMSKNIVLDFMTGTETIELAQVSTYKSVSRFEFYYYLRGTVGSKNYRFKISSDEAAELKNASSVTISFYPRTSRILKIHHVSKFPEGYYDWIEEHKDGGQWDEELWEKQKKELEKIMEKHIPVS